MPHTSVIVVNGKSIEIESNRKNDPSVYGAIWNWICEQTDDEIAVSISELPREKGLWDMYPRTIEHFHNVTYKKDDDGEYWAGN